MKRKIGGSGGGGLAAGSTLLARDRKGPKLAGQLLQCPMIDDRNETVSSSPYQGTGVGARTSSLTAWTAVLGDRRGSDNVSPSAAPARATDLSALPPTFIDVGAAEVFRDEAVAYASAIWAAGAPASSTSGAAPSTGSTTSPPTQGSPRPASPRARPGSHVF